MADDIILVGKQDSGQPKITRSKTEYVKKIGNYIGQLRPYSLVDLLFLLLAAKASLNQLIGAVFLWVGFILLLEYRHRHPYRLAFYKYLWFIAFLAGLVLYPAVEALLFILFSYLYTYKNKGWWGGIAPLLGGSLNRFFLVAGITGYVTPLPWIVFVVLGFRNLLGDVRDGGKDAAEGLKTIPVLLGLHRDIPYIHLIGILATTILWWQFTTIAFPILAAALAFQVVTYNLTPRRE